MAERVEESHDWRETGWWEAEGVSELVRRKTGGGGGSRGEGSEQVRIELE